MLSVSSFCLVLRNVLWLISNLNIILNEVTKHKSLLYWVTIFGFFTFLTALLLKHNLTHVGHHDYQQNKTKAQHGLPGFWTLPTGKSEENHEMPVKAIWFAYLFCWAWGSQTIQSLKLTHNWLIWVGMFSYLFLD